MKVTKVQIDDFLNSQKIAIAGVSANKKKFGNHVFKLLLEKGYEVLPINPNHSEIEGVKCFKEVNELPDDIESLLILTPKDQTDFVLKSALDKRVKNIWIQQHSETAESLKIAAESGQQIISKKCIFMFAEPTGGIHKFHKNLVKLFGGYPN